MHWHKTGDFSTTGDGRSQADDARGSSGVFTSLSAHPPAAGLTSRICASWTQLQCTSEAKDVAAFVDDRGTPQFCRSLQRPSSETGQCGLKASDAGVRQKIRHAHMLKRMNIAGICRNALTWAFCPTVRTVCWLTVCSWICLLHQTMYNCVVAVDS